MTLPTQTELTKECGSQCLERVFQRPDVSAFSEAYFPSRFKLNKKYKDGALKIKLFECGLTCRL